MSANEKYAAAPDAFPAKGSSGTSRRDAYKVQARLAYHRPQEVCGVLLDTRWTDIPFNHEIKLPGRFGVPGDTELARHGLLTYPQAQSMRWWFHAEASSGLGGGWCIETRLVKASVKLTYEVEFISAHDVVGGEDRSHVMPDWGKKDASEEVSK